MSDKTEKPYTLKKVQSELKRLEASKQKKKEKIQALTAEMKTDSARIKELEVIYDRLYHEDLQRQISTAWFKEKKMTAEQVSKFLELSKQIHDKIDILDVAMVVEAVSQVYDAQQHVSEEQQPEKVDTYSTLDSAQTSSIHTNYVSEEQQSPENVDTYSTSASTQASSIHTDRQEGD